MTTATTTTASKPGTKNSNSSNANASKSINFWKYGALFFFVATILLQIRHSQYDITIISGYRNQIEYSHVIYNNTNGDTIATNTLTSEEDAVTSSDTVPSDNEQTLKQKLEQQQARLRQQLQSLQHKGNNKRGDDNSNNEGLQSSLFNSNKDVNLNNDEQGKNKVLHKSMKGKYDQESNENENTKHLIVDDLIWYTNSVTGRPATAPIVGWEDDWMIRWKQNQYNPEQRIGCIKGVESPYGSNDVICELPAYIPARIPHDQPSSLRKNENKNNHKNSNTENEFIDNGIPRVIFISWMTRKLGRYLYTSVLTLIQFNPDYEIVFFTDDDIDHFMCDNYPLHMSNSITKEFSQVKSGAGRVDVWRMVIMERYGGVYLDIDMSALRPLPIINAIDSMYSGIAGYTYAPNKLGGTLEHWSFGVAPHHPLIKQTINQIQSNIQEWKEYDVGGKYYETNDDYSFTVSLTGPGPFQKALHDLLEQVGCTPVKEEWDEDPYWYPVLENPKKHCKKHYRDKFTKIFGKQFRMSSILDMNNSITPKLLDNDEETSILEHNYDYDAEQYKMGDIDEKFCTTESFTKRTKSFNKRWEQSLKSDD